MTSHSFNDDKVSLHFKVALCESNQTICIASLSVIFSSAYFACSHPPSSTTLHPY